MKTKSSSRSLRSGRDSFSTTGASGERILSWRQGIRSTPSVRNGSISSKNGSGNRSISPRKSSGQLSARSRDTRGSPALGTSDSLASSKVTLPTASTSQDHQPPPQQAELRSTETNPLMMIGEQSNLFWNVDEKRRMAEKTRRDWLAEQGQDKVGGSEGGLGLSPLKREGSYVSRLSIDRSRSSMESSAGESEYEDAKG